MLLELVLMRVSKTLGLSLLFKHPQDFVALTCIKKNKQLIKKLINQQLHYRLLEEANDSYLQCLICTI